MTDLNHVDLGNVPAEMHGALWRTVADVAALLLINVSAADVAQMRLVRETDTGEVWYPKTTGVAASWARLVTSDDPNYAGGKVALYGDASDGALTITSSDVTYSAEKNYSTISWGVGATGRLLVPATAVAGYAIKCQMLDFTNGFAGCIQCNGIVGGNGAAQTTGGVLGGTRTLVDNAQIGASVAGLTGGAGGTTTGVAGTNGSSITFANGGVGGNSGAGGNGTSGNGGAGKTGGSVTLGRRLHAAVPPEELFAGVAGSTGSFRQIQGGASGASGSGGGGDGTQGGGGGASGGGGPVVAIYAETWILGTTASAIQCKGATGGNGGTPAAGNRGGGSGGAGSGGGYLYACGDKFIGTCANLFDVSGGAGGNGGAASGSGTAGAGGNGGGGGNADIIQRGVGRIAQATGTTGAAASGATGGAGETTRVGL